MSMPEKANKEAAPPSWSAKVVALTYTPEKENPVAAPTSASGKEEHP